VIVGVLSDTHDEIARTRVAVDLLRSRGAEVLIHCGDLAGPEIVEICSVLPFYFVFGNWDADMTAILEEAARTHRATCLGWGGEITLAGKRIAVVHGHLTMDLRPLMEAGPDYLLSGHSHESWDRMEGRVRRVNPGALYRAEEYSVAVVDLGLGEVRFERVDG
jgi:putative phosphoesterase